MKARLTPSRQPSSPVDALWDHGDRIDTLERRSTDSGPFVRELVAQIPPDWVMSDMGPWPYPLWSGVISTPLYHLDGGTLRWALASLSQPVDPEGTGYGEVIFVVDGVELSTKIRFDPGVIVASCAFADPIPFEPSVTRIQARWNNQDSDPALGLTVQYRFGPLDS